MGGLVSVKSHQVYYQQGFQAAIFVVVWIIVAGGAVAVFQKMPTREILPSGNDVVSRAADVSS